MGSYDQLSRLAHSFLHLIYPPLCLYCHESLSNPDWVFCAYCSDLFQLLEPTERCLYCFGEIGNAKNQVCYHCLNQPSVLTRVAAAMDDVGPAACLVKRLKSANQPYLARTAAALMVAQYVRLDWPMPDLIVPVPMSALKQVARGYNQSLLIALEFGQLIGAPMIHALEREHGDYHQTGLTLAQRQELSGSTFSWNRCHPLMDKRVLLIDDVMVSGSTLKRCGEALVEGCPAELYGFAFCRSICA